MIHDAEKLPLKPSNPKVMITGLKGSGVTTQIQKLCEKFNLEEFVLKDELLKRLDIEKKSRQRRRLLDRGFKKPELEEGQKYEDYKDPEIVEDPDDFEKGDHEKDMMKLIFDS